MVASAIVDKALVSHLVVKEGKEEEDTTTGSSAARCSRLTGETRPLKCGAARAVARTLPIGL